MPMIDFKIAVRMLARTPLVTGVAILSLALGIGANVALFSIFQQLLVRPLPVRAPHELVNLGAPGPKPGDDSCNEAGGCDEVFSYPMFRDLERASTGFRGVAAHRVIPVNAAHQGRAENAWATLVSGSYFPVLGLEAALGRLLSPADDAIGGAYVAVLSHEYWRSRFGADPRVLHETLVINGRPFTIVGVAPERFTGTTVGLRARLFVPLSMREVLQPDERQFQERRAYWLYLFARRPPGVSIEAAYAAANAVYRPILETVEAPLQAGMSEETMRRFKTKPLTVAAGGRGQSVLHDNMARPIVLVWLVSAIVLIVACANIANLLLARSAGRAGEMAVRLSLGAGRGRIVAQLLAESCLLALGGGLVGLLVARWTLAGIQTLLPPEIGGAVRFALEPVAMLFAAGLSVGTGLLFGLFPALHSTRPDLLSTLKDQSGRVSGARVAARFRHGLATAQIALAMALLGSAGLFTRSLMNVGRVDLGLDPERVVTFRLAPGLNGYSPARTRAFFERLEQELRGLPGARSASAALVPSLAGHSTGGDVTVEGFEVGPDTNTNARSNWVGAAYLQTMGMPLLAGRAFSAADSEAAPKVAVVNEAFARKFKLGREVIGKRIATFERNATRLDVEIVGLVQDAKYDRVKGGVPALFLQPYRQREGWPGMYFYVRTEQDPARTLAAIPGLVARLDPHVAVEELKTMPQQIRENVYLDRATTLLSASFALLATLLAAVGLYGVLAYTLAQRTREMGVRMALGAQARDVRRLVMGEVARMAIVGVGLGLAAAVALGTLARSLLFQLEAYDPAALMLSAALLGVIALASGLVPAVRASRIEPLQALRYD